MEGLLSLAVSPLALVMCALALLLLFFYVKLCYLPFQVLKRNGFHGPTPSFFYGNYKLWLKAGGGIELMDSLYKEYGDVVGFYMGKQPFVLVNDVQLIKLITVRDFDHFVDRIKIADFTSKKDKPYSILRLKGESWKSARRTLSPSFSSLKMKKMTPIIKSSVNTLVEVFQQHASTKSFDFSKIFGSFTLETIIATAFGRVIDIQRGQSEGLSDAAIAIFASIGKKSSFDIYRFMLLFSNFPYVEPVFQYLTSGTVFATSIGVIRETAVALVQERRKEKDTEKYTDLLQLMIDATPERGGDKFTDDEIVGHSMDYLLAGYETTSNALSYVSYLLALNPHAQEKLQGEIDAYFQENSDASLYQAAQDIEYLNMVVQESLRLYPPVPLFGRTCTKDYHCKDFTFPRGCMVQVCAPTLHMNESYWKEPEKFDPSRFTAEEKANRPQHCYVPFGSGPRNCIGMRLALLETKIALIELLKRFTFQRTPDTQVPLKTVLGVTQAPANGIYLKVTMR